MRVSFDHNLPHKLRTELTALSMHAIVTPFYMGWRELKNGELLRKAEKVALRFSSPGTKPLPTSRTLKL